MIHSRPAKKDVLQDLPRVVNHVIIILSFTIIAKAHPVAHPSSLAVRESSI